MSEVIKPKIDLENKLKIRDISQALCKAALGNCNNLSCDNCVLFYGNQEHLKSLLETTFEINNK